MLKDSGLDARGGDARDCHPQCKRPAMKILKKLAILTFCGLASLSITPGFAQEADLPDFDGGIEDTARLPPLRSWMSPEIAGAWAQGYQGRYSHITLVDDFRSRSVIAGNLGTGNRRLRHGDWTRMVSDLIAPAAGLTGVDFSSQRAIVLKAKVLNVINLSYGMEAEPGYSGGLWGLRETSIVNYAASGSAVVVKAAGNSSVAIGSVNGAGKLDYLNGSLTGTNALFVGALNKNGTVDAPASMASYSNFAGSNPLVQDRFLSVGVRGDLTGLNGTSFAAPIVSGYAAVMGSKFRTATPTQIANQLLDTARTDTILGYDVAVHGQGEASIARALAPAAIN